MYKWYSEKLYIKQGVFMHLVSVQQVEANKYTYILTTHAVKSWKSWRESGLRSTAFLLLSQELEWRSSRFAIGHVRKKKVIFTDSLRTCVHYTTIYMWRISPSVYCLTSKYLYYKSVKNEFTLISTIKQVLRLPRS